MISMLSFLPSVEMTEDYRRSDFSREHLQFATEVAPTVKLRRYIKDRQRENTRCV